MPFMKEALQSSATSRAKQQQQQQHQETPGPALEEARQPASSMEDAGLPIGSAARLQDAARSLRKEQAAKRDAADSPVNGCSGQRSRAAAARRDQPPAYEAASRERNGRPRGPTKRRRTDRQQAEGGRGNEKATGEETKISENRQSLFAQRGAASQQSEASAKDTRSIGVSHEGREPESSNAERFMGQSLDDNIEAALHWKQQPDKQTSLAAAQSLTAKDPGRQGSRGKRQGDGGKQRSDVTAALGQPALPNGDHRSDLEQAIGTEAAIQQAADAANGRPSPSPTTNIDRSMPFSSTDRQIRSEEKARKLTSPKGVFARLGLVTNASGPRNLGPKGRNGHCQAASVRQRHGL